MTIKNFNIGLLGHVDSGKTSLAKVLSEISSTAAFDKSNQSQERGITLDLGFSALTIDAPDKIKQENAAIEKLQLTFVDCPGHASLIRTIIGGAQIIDMMILVIDAQKGIQTQTAECIVIGELLQRKLIVVVNKIDMLDAAADGGGSGGKRELALKKLDTKLRKALSATKFGDNFPIYHVSALSGEGIAEFLNGIKDNVFLPQRNRDLPFLMYVDHCFSIKGQGTICTGTIIQGCCNVNDTIDIPKIKEQRKIKSIQMFRRPVTSAEMGDRVGICVTQFSAKAMERGIVCAPGYMQLIYAALIQLRHIQFYKFAIKSKTKLHISVGHETVMANITLFKAIEKKESREFNPIQEYEYLDELDMEKIKESGDIIYCLLEFETPIYATKDSLLIASKLDLDIHSNCCRLAFWGNIEWYTNSSNYVKEQLPTWKVFKSKEKRGNVQRLVNDQDIIVQNLFKKESNRQLYIGKRIQLSTGECGQIESTFGQTSKVKITFRENLKEDTLQLLKEGKFNEVTVILKYKKYVYNKNLGIIQ
ncbi:selenocysteine-specific elongation factor [Musca vetustissima]|uniref:selenocysteine-specific elongation factor n=1 Tax=Musca vetustissima TaxID=27455 RepID=UPI002AB675A6|nr:selenocysteine-specific elongation factor [Musca vetustissima]